MKHLQKLTFVLALCLLLTALPVKRAFAADGGSMWLRHFLADGGESVALVADTTVASGVITLTYDTAVFTFKGLTVDSTYVLAHAVNDQEAGTLKISWVGTGAGSGVHVLMRLQFAFNWWVSGGNPGIGLSGSVQNTKGEAIGFTTLDFAALNAAVREADGLKAEDYTADSFAAVKAARDAAMAQAEVETLTLAQLEAALQTLKSALDGLKAKEPTPPDPTEPTEPTEPTQPAPTEPKPTESKPVETKPTEPAATQPADQDPQDEDGMMLIPILVGCCVPIVVAVVLLKKRGKK